MSDPNANANANSIADKLDGQVNGQPLSYDVVTMLTPGTVFGLRDGTYPQGEGPNSSSSLIDKVTTLAKILSRTYVASDGKTYDLWDATMTLLEAQLKKG